MSQKRAQDALRVALPGEPHVVMLLGKLLARGADASLRTVEALEFHLIEQDCWLTDVAPAALPFILTAAEDGPVRGPLLALCLKLMRLATTPFSPELDAEERALGVARAARVRTCLNEACERYFAWLDDVDDDVRGCAALLLSLCEHDAHSRTRAEVALSATLAREQVAVTRVALLAALEHFAAYESARGFLGDSAACVQLVAALMLLHVDAPPAPCFDVVARALCTLPDTRRTYEEAERYRPLALVASVTRAGRPAAVALLPALLTALLESGPHAAEQMLAPLLDLFFPGPCNDDLDAAQGAILEAILRHPRYFSGIASPQLVLLRHGLPTTRAQLADMAKRSPEARLSLLPRT